MRPMRPLRREARGYSPVWDLLLGLVLLNKGHNPRINAIETAAAIYTGNAKMGMSV